MPNPNDPTQNPDQKLADIASKRQELDDKLKHLETTITDKFKNSVGRRRQGLHDKTDHAKEKIESAVGDYLQLTEDQIAQIKHALKQRQKQAKQALNLKRHTREHPYVMVGAALATGVAVGAFVGKGRLINGKSLTQAGSSIAKASKSASEIAGLAVKDVISAGDRFVESALGSEGALADGYLGTNVKQALSELARDVLSQWTWKNFPNLAPHLETLAESFIAGPQGAAEPAAQDSQPPQT